MTFLLLVWIYQNSPCDPCNVHCCLHWCANCQEHRERRGRLAESSAVPMTVVNPPPVQEMRSMPDTAAAAAAGSEMESREHEAAAKSEHDDVEVIPL
jgi:hypothetical protein